MLPDVLPDKAYDNRQLLFVGSDFHRKGGSLLLEAFRAILPRPAPTLALSEN